MQLKDLLKAACLGVAALGLAACSSNSVTDSDVSSQESTGSSQQVDEGAQQGGADVEIDGVSPILTAEEQERQRVEAMRQESQVVYFEFDRSEISGEFIEILEAHAAYLLDNPSVTVLIEGHTDERGTPEYNVALGERRAKAVARHLQSLGVLASQISTVSYGQEKPVDSSHTEAAWAANRRAVLVY